MKYYVYRTGYNGANNSAMGGGPETVKVAEVEADNADQAIALTRESGISCYNNQYFSAKPKEDVEQRAAEVQRRVRPV